MFEAIVAREVAALDSADAVILSLYCFDTMKEIKNGKREEERTEKEENYEIVY